MPEVTLARWNEYLTRHPQAHFLQTGEWGELKSRFGWSASRIIVGDCGAQVLFRNLPLGFSLAYIPKSSADQLASPGDEQFWAEVDRMCRKRRTVFCKLEPDIWATDDQERGFGNHLQIAGGRPSVRPGPSIQPRRTIVVDLRPTEETILARMKPKCRYNIRLAEKKGVVVRPWKDIGAFHAMLTATAERDAFSIHSSSYYEFADELFGRAASSQVLLAEHAGQPLAALMVLARGRRAWYVYGGSTDRARDKMPNYLLQWEAMRWARNRGCEEYDLWGVPDEEETALEAGFASRRDGLWGVYRFKRGFGGELRRSAPALDRVYIPPLYGIYSTLASRGSAG